MFCNPVQKTRFDTGEITEVQDPELHLACYSTTRARFQGTRDIAAFNQYSDWIFHHPHTRDDEMSWLEQQGPWCPALLEYLEKNAHTYDVLVFFTYLYAPTVLGLKIDPARSILVPTAHDEPAIHLEIFKEVFSLPAGIFVFVVAFELVPAKVDTTRGTCWKKINFFPRILPDISDI